MFSDYSRFILPNKLRVICVPMKEVSSVTVLVMVGAGSRYEDKDKMGLSHFLEHMCFKGTTKRPTSFLINSAVDSVGGENNAFTGIDQTAYYIRLQNRHLELAFDILSDSLRDSLYLQEEIDRERGTIIEEINMYEDTPMSKIEDVFLSTVFDGHPLGWPTAGEKKTVANINRQDFFDYTKRFYQGSDMSLIVAGGVEKSEVSRLAEKYFSSFTSGKKEKYLPFGDKQNKPRVNICYKKTDQAHIFFGFPTFSFSDPDKAALSVLSTILGKGMSSRLFIQVRERRGLAYYIVTSNEFTYETGYLAARAGLNLSKLEEAVKVIKEEYEKIKEGEVEEEEIKKAKEFIKGRTILSLENNNSLARWYAEEELLGEQITTPDDFFARIDKVTPGDIKRVAGRIMRKEKSNLAIVGPFKDKKRFEKLLE